ncbi:MAG: peptide chain release factor N(5)-glutamine methyltransferase [Gammaproteobacteria bacterium]
MKITLDQALATAQTALENAGAARTDARVDARVLLAAALEQDRAYLIAHGDARLLEPVARTFQAWIERRGRGEPVAYLLGQREFWTLDLCVTPDTLIPRPDTETLVSAALERWPAAHENHALDLGTGSGAIALALASERPHAHVTATDRSTQAIKIAQDNARRNELKNLTWHTGHWFDALPADAKFDLIVSNPPYVAPDDHHLEIGDVAFEPRTALVADDAGYADLYTIIENARDFLRPGSYLLVEHGATQGERVADFFVAAGFGDVGGLRDLAGRPRVTFGRHA